MGCEWATRRGDEEEEGGPYSIHAALPSTDSTCCAAAFSYFDMAICRLKVHSLAPRTPPSCLQQYSTNALPSSPFFLRDRLGRSEGARTGTGRGTGRRTGRRTGTTGLRLEVLMDRGHLAWWAWWAWRGGSDGAERPSPYS
jgi:hypothetical protein